MIKIGSKGAPLIVQEKQFKGRTFVDIRKYFTNNENQELPTKKGIMLSKQKCAILIDHIIESGILKGTQSSVAEKISSSDVGVLISDFEFELSNGENLLKLDSRFCSKIENLSPIQVFEILSSIMYEEYIDDDKSWYRIKNLISSSL